MERNERVSLFLSWNITDFHKCHFGGDLKEEGRGISHRSACPVAALVTDQEWVWWDDCGQRDSERASQADTMNLV